MIKFKNYMNAYVSILFESQQHDVISSNNMISKPLSEHDLKKLIDTMILVNPSKDNIKILYDPENLLNESKNYSDILISILNSESGQIFNKSKIKSLLNKKWNLYKKFIPYIKPFYVFKFNFSNEEEIKIVYKTYIAADEDILDFYSKKFVNNSGNSNGVYLHSNDFKAICLNTNKPINISLIIHEFTHYIQDVFNYENVEFDDEFLFDENKISFLNLNKEELNVLHEIFIEDEIMPYINEFIEYLIVIINDYKKHIKVDLNIFIEFLQKSFVNNSDIYKSELFKKYVKITNDLTPLYVFICCMVFNVNKNEILNKIKEEL